MKTIHTTLLSFAFLLSSCVSTDTSSAAGGGAVKPYPLSTCIVSDNDLGSMGPVITKVYNGQEVKFCCKPCVKEFEAEPAKFLARLPR